MGRRPSLYQTAIAEDAKALGVEIDPRHVEAAMRLQYGTLNHLPRETFLDEILLAVECERLEPGSGERLALSFGL